MTWHTVDRDLACSGNDSGYFHNDGKYVSSECENISATEIPIFDSIYIAIVYLYFRINNILRWINKYKTESKIM